MSAQSMMIESHREGAEVYTGAICKQKSNELYDELHLPRGIVPMTDLLEVGYNRSTGFLWFRQEQPVTHKFKKLGQVSSFAAEVTAFAEDRRMSQLTGVKTRELMLWFTITDLFIDAKTPDKITFKSALGVSKSFPVSAFEEEEEEGEEEEANGAETGK